METIISALAFVILGYSLSATKLVSEGNEALVERLGKYHRRLKPGINFIVPFVDTIVVEDTTRLQVLDVAPQNIITKNNVTVKVDAVVFWKIIDLEKTFYQIDDIQVGLTNIVVTTLRSTLGGLELEGVISAREEVNTKLLQALDDVTATWGVKVLRVELQDIALPPDVQASLAQQQAAEIARRAAVSKAEGDKRAEILRAEATKESLQIITAALGPQAKPNEILRYLVAKDYVDASQKLGESPNAKIVFVDPANSSEMFQELISEQVGETAGSNGSNS